MGLRGGGSALCGEREEPSPALSLRARLSAGRIVGGEGVAVGVLDLQKRRYYYYVVDSSR